MADPRVQLAQLYQDAKAAHARREYARAVPLYRRVLERRPNDALLLRLLGAAELGIGDLEAGAKRLTQSLELNPKDAGAWADLATAHLHLAHLAPSEAAARRAIELDPSLVGVLPALCRSLCTQGRPEEAERALAPFADQLDDGPPALAEAFAFTAVRTDQAEAGVKMLGHWLERRDTPTALRFQLGELLEAARRYDQAWALYESANAGLRTQFDASRFRAEGDTLLHAWASEETARMPAAGFETERPLFLVGLPRAGLGIAEQILASHPQVHALGATGVLPTLGSRLINAVGASSAPLRQRLGAITRQLIDRAGAAYLNDAQKRNDDAARVVERLAGGFALVGWIRRILPGARVVYVLREATDTGVSAYCRDMPARPMWASDLATCGGVVRLERKFMALWAERADVPIHTFCYERLLEEPEREIRALIEFTGLPWNDACLRYGESEKVAPSAPWSQSRLPIHTRSVGRSDWYRRHLGPMLEAMADEPADSATT